MENKNNLTLFQRVQLETLWYCCRGFAMLPYWFRYQVIARIIFFVLYYCLRYRMKVVKENLRNSFPEKGKLELLIIRRKFYHVLSEVFVCMISLARMTNKECRRYADICDYDKLRRETLGKDWIAMAAHYGCWEYCNFLGLFDPKTVVAAVYHPLRNKMMEEFFLRLRHRDNSIPVPMQESLRFYLRHRDSVSGKNVAMGLIADQNPPRRPDSHWFHFLNQDTLFFDGGEKLAIKCKLPVYFTWIRRVKRGYYEMTFEQMYDGKEEIAEYEITERYVRRLETMIQEHPELWMWSHRRWKHKRECQPK